MVMKITIDDRRMRRFVREMPKASNRSVSRALNKAITGTRTHAARAISAKRNIKVGRARDEMRLYKASPAKPEAAIVARSNPIKLMEVKGAKTQTKRGVTVKIGPGPRHLYEGAFIAKTKSGHIGVFTKESKLTHKSKGDSPGTKRFNLPIIEIALPSVAATLVQKDIDKLLRDFAVPVYEKELIRLLEFEMKKHGAR